MKQRTRKLVMMLASLLAAILLWLYVVTSVAPEATTRISGIEINLDGTIVLEERGLIITSQDADMLSLELSTPRVNLSKLNAKSIRVNADASKIREPGEYTLPCVVASFPDQAEPDRLCQNRVFGGGRQRNARAGRDCGRRPRGRGSYDRQGCGKL